MNRHSSISTDIGRKIREIRNKLGLSIRELAERVGVSYLTMQRIETDKISPSVVLLAQISACLSYPLSGFLLETKRPVIHIEAGSQNAIRTSTMLLKLVAAKGIVNENLSIVHGKAEKGKLVDRHRHPGFELAYVIKGRALHKHGADTREVGEGDLVFFDANQWHEVTALEAHEWLGIQFYSGTVRLGDENGPAQKDAPPTNESERPRAARTARRKAKGRKGEES